MFCDLRDHCAPAPVGAMPATTISHVRGANDAAVWGGVSVITLARSSDKALIEQHHQSGIQPVRVDCSQTHRHPPQHDLRQCTSAKIGMAEPAGENPMKKPGSKGS